MFKLCVYAMLALCAAYAVQARVNYCKLSCNDKQPDKRLVVRHFACNHPNEFDSACRDNAQMLPMTEAMKSSILDAHNKLRSKIASGNEARFQRACAMMTSGWNDELAYLAELNVMKCYSEHEKCRRTSQFEQPGQNIAYESSTEKLDIEFIIPDMVGRWYNECHSATQDNVDRGYGGSVLHFLTLINEGQTDIGCAAALFNHLEDSSMKTLLFTCNYKNITMSEQPVYNKCRSAGEKCKSPNSRYPGLCMGSGSNAGSMQKSEAPRVTAPAQKSSGGKAAPKPYEPYQKPQKPREQPIAATERSVEKSERMQCVVRQQTAYGPAFECINNKYGAAVFSCERFVGNSQSSCAFETADSQLDYLQLGRRNIAYYGRQENDKYYLQPGSAAYAQPQPAQPQSQPKPQKERNAAVSSVLARCEVDPSSLDDSILKMKCQKAKEQPGRPAGYIVYLICKGNASPYDTKDCTVYSQSSDTYIVEMFFSEGKINDFNDKITVSD